jgi:3D (Asp-Asp-Asp) domain-containing protein
MNYQLKCPKWGKNLIYLLIIIGIFFGISLPGTLRAPLVMADLAEGFDQKALKELAITEGNSLLPLPRDFFRVLRMEVIITGYSSTPWETDDEPYITAAGTFVRDGVVANNYLPIGTKIRIPELFGDKIFVVEDRMNWRKSDYHIDIWFPDYWQAINFGAKRTYIEILEK